MTGEHVIHDMPAPWEVRHVVETGSTNDDLLEAVEAGAARDGTVLVTDHQTAGRGRLDRRWSAPPGTNLLVSLLFGDGADASSAAWSTQRVGLAAVEGLERLMGERSPELGLKWPNDVVVGDRKLAGILAQRSSTTGAVVVGMGMNVGWAPDGAASTTEDLGLDARPLDVLRSVLAELSADRIGGGAGGSGLRDRYRERLTTLGRDVRVELPGDRQVLGRAVDVDADGRLVVDDESGDRHVLDVGDVVHLRPR